MENVDGALLWVQRQYFQAVPMKYFDWGKLNSLKSVGQLLVLKATCLHPLSLKYPPSDSYKLSFLKRLLTLYEDNGWEICDDICKCISDIISKKYDEDDGFKYKTYILPCGKPITLCEATQFISQGTTGLNSWQAGLVLCDWVIQNTGIVRGKKVMELGCGIGLAGLVAMHICRPSVYVFTDCHEKVLQKVKENLKINGFMQEQQCRVSKGENKEKEERTIENEEFCFGTRGRVSKIKASDETDGKNTNEAANGATSRRGLVDRIIETSYFKGRCNLGDSVFFLSSDSSKDCLTCAGLNYRDGSDNEMSYAAVCRLDWQSWSDSDAQQYSPDVILAADVIFDPSVIDCFVDVIKMFLSMGRSGMAVAYIASTVRNKDTHETFLLSLGRSGIRTYSILDIPENIFFCQTECETTLLRLEL